MNRHSDDITFPPVSQFAETPVKRTVLFIAIIVLLTSAIRVPLLSIPFERDEGAYAYIAWRLGHHELPYRDWIDQKPPGVYLVYRLALSLPLDPIRSVHAMGMLFSAASACALFFLARRFLSVPLAGCAAVMFAILSADPRVEGTAANTELFMLLPLILSQLVFLSAVSEVRHRIPLMILSGVLTGIAVGFKQVAGVNWFFLVAMYPVFAAEGNRLRGTLSFAAWSAVGAASVWGLLVIYFFSQHGLGDFIYNIFTQNFGYIRTRPWAPSRTLCLRTLATLSHTQALVWALAAAGMVALGMSGRTKWLLFLAGWLVTSLIGVSASGFYFPHYFQQLLPVISLAGVLGAEAVYGARCWRKVPAWGRKAVLGVTLIILPAITIYPFIFTYTPAEAVRNIYPDNHFAEMPEIGRRIAQLTGPDDRVFIFGAEPEVLFYAQRVSATRYIYLFTLYGPYRDARERQIAVAKEIVHARPTAALYLPNGLFYMPGTEQFLNQWSLSYLETEFSPYAYLTVDQVGIGHIISTDNNRVLSVPQGQQKIAVVSVRIAR
jgi:hypothetical protein